MESLQAEIIQCPYCGERIELLVDCSISDQEYTEDCSVCCRPIIVTVMASDGEVISLEGRTEDD